MLSKRVPFQRWSVQLHAAIAGVLLVAVAAGGWWSLQKEHASLLALQNQRIGLQAQLGTRPGRVATPPGFVQSLPSVARVDDVSRDVGQFAKNSDVQVASIAIDTHPASNTELGRVQFNVSAQAEYKNAKVWLAELLGRYPSLGIQSLSMRAHPTDPARQDVRVALVLYVKD